jgi:hypothetical protein
MNSASDSDRDGSTREASRLDEPRRRDRTSAAPWFLGLAVLLLVVAGVVTLLRSSDAARYAPPSAGNPEQPIEALRGELSLPRGGRIVAQLTALRSDPQSQRFEAESLRRELDQESGEPWRLHLRWDVGAAPGGGESAGGADFERGAELVASVSALELHDSAGLAARAWTLNTTAESGPTDPVAALFAAPTSGLGPGQAVDVVLWGRKANGRVELRGFALGAGEPAAIALEETTLARAELERPFTYQTRGDEVVQPGKPRAAGASDRRARTRVPSDG